MKQLNYTLSFTTPAFLGNAEQAAQWRTPPIKALIRQWWRVVKAPTLNTPFDVAKLRAAENALFGAASDDGAEKSHRSLLRLRLTKEEDGGNGWESGNLKSWPIGAGTLNHPNVKFPVGAELYLGFGPLEYDKATKSTKLGQSKSSGEKRTAIDDKARGYLRLMFPETHEQELQTALQLAAWFGTLGSRSRNGWGALQLANPYLQPLTRANLENLAVCRSLSLCLEEEWPHAIGQDEDGRPLVWRTRVCGDWRAVMKELARLKIRFRTEPDLLSLEGKADGMLAGRHILGYPVTHHSVHAWGGLGRVANQLRFKVAKAADGGLEGIIVHLPCKLPEELLGKLSRQDQQFIRDNELRVWQAVHAVLDHHATRLA